MTRAFATTICIWANVFAILLLAYLSYFFTAAYMVGCHSSYVAMEKRGYIDSTYRGNAIDLMEAIPGRGIYFWILGITGAVLCVLVSMISFGMAQRIAAYERDNQNIVSM